MGIKDRINWFIKLRWYAILGVLLILFVSEFIFEITLEYRNLFFGIILLYITKGLKKMKINYTGLLFSKFYMTFSYSFILSIFQAI
jgi:hypothetical protein